MKRIKSIKLHNSAFFEDDFSIEFSEKLNCLMGGRGTGKSTLLYFIKSALSENAEEDKTITSLLKNNLHNGTITICLEGTGGKEFKIVKTFGDEPLVSMSPTDTHLSLKGLAEYIEFDIYPALSIEEIGKNSADRLKLIDKRIQVNVDEIKSEIENIKISLNQNAHSIRTENARIAKLKAELLNYAAAATDLKNWKANKSEDITEAEQEEFEKADDKEKIRNAEARYVKNVIRKLSELQASFSDLDDEIASIIKLNDSTATFTNKNVTNQLVTEIKNALISVSKKNNESRDLLAKCISTVETLSQPLTTLHGKQQAEFIQLKQKLEMHREYITKYNQLSKKVEERNLLRSEIKEVEEKQKKLTLNRETLVKNLNDKKKNLFTLRMNTVDQLNTELGGHVKITLTFGGITDEYENMLRNALKGSNLRYNAIIPYIVESFTPDKFAAAIHTKNMEELKKISEIDAERSTALIQALYEKQEIYDIESLYVEDLPEFFLKVDERDDKTKVLKENFKRSDELSTGQRCTTVLPIVFAVSDNPLMIDQPEDNLDNEFINDAIRKIVQDQKQKRQLIFITHNPNIPVVSDAEFNVFLHYANKKAYLENSGSVDDVKENILNLLEGGKEAFDKRKELYEPI